MHKSLKFGVLLAIATMSPVSAHSNQPAEWWLVLDDGNAQEAHFVDLASISQSDNGAHINTMTVSRSGAREMQMLTVDCERSLSAPGEAAVKEFVCGTAEERERSGLILGAVSPDEMAAILFAGQSGSTGASGNDIA